MGVSGTSVLILSVGRGCSRGSFLFSHNTAQCGGIKQIKGALEPDKTTPYLAPLGQGSALESGCATACAGMASGGEQSQAHKHVANVVQARDKKGRKFFYHCPSGSSSWFRPSLQIVPHGTPGATPAVSVAEEEGALPPQAAVLWSEKRDRKRRKVYVNSLTGKASWSKPAAYSSLDLALVAVLRSEEAGGPPAADVSASASQRPDQGAHPKYAGVQGGETSDASSCTQQEGSLEASGSQVAAHGDGEVPQEGSLEGAPALQQGSHAALGAAGPVSGRTPPSASPQQPIHGENGTSLPPSRASRDSSGRLPASRPRTPPLAGAKAAYGDDAVVTAPSAEMPSFSRASLRVPREGAGPVPEHVASRVAGAKPSTPSPQGLLEQRRAQRRRRATFNPFAAVTQLRGHSTADEAAAVHAALTQGRAGLVQAPARDADSASDVASVMSSAPGETQAPTMSTSPPEPVPLGRRGSCGTRAEAEEAGDILFHGGLVRSRQGTLQQRPAAQGGLPHGDAPQGHQGSHTDRMLARHAASDTPHWARQPAPRPAVDAAAAATRIPIIGAILPPTAPAGGLADAPWEDGMTVSESASYLWDGDASQLRADGIGAEAAARLSLAGSVARAKAGGQLPPWRTASLPPGRIQGTLVNVAALVDAASDGNVVWVETFDAEVGEIGAVPFRRSSDGELQRGDLIPRPVPVGTPGGQGGAGVPDMQAIVSADAASQVGMVKWTGAKAKQVPVPARPSPTPHQHRMARVEAAVLGSPPGGTGVLQPLPEGGQEEEEGSGPDGASPPGAGGSESADSPPLHASRRPKGLSITVAEDTGGLSVYSGESLGGGSHGTGSSWAPPAPAPLYVMGRPLTAADLRTMYGGGVVDTNTVSGSGPPSLPSARPHGGYDSHEDGCLPSSPTRADSDSSDGWGLLSPRTEGRKEAWARQATTPRMTAAEIQATAASDYALSANKRPSFAMAKLTASAAKRRSKPPSAGLTTVQDEPAAEAAAESRPPPPSGPRPTQ